MARTYRNKNSVPDGYVVRDDGRIYHKSAPSKSSEREHWKSFTCSPAICTFRHPAGDCPICFPPRYRRRWSRCEKKKHRKAHYRRYRAQVRDLMRHERYEDIPEYTRTGGWETW